MVVYYHFTFYSKTNTRGKLFANSVDPDQTPHSGASDLALHCLPINLLGVFRLQRVKPVLFARKVTLNSDTAQSIHLDREER